jgi:hypothetical protein
MKEYKPTPAEKLTGNTLLKTVLLDCERNNKKVTFYTHTRNFIDRFTCIDHPDKPITLEKFFLNSGLIYYKKNQFEWKTISLDDIDKIEIA